MRGKTEDEKIGEVFLLSLLVVFECECVNLDDGAVLRSQSRVIPVAMSAARALPHIAEVSRRRAEGPHTSHTSSAMKHRAVTKSCFSFHCIFSIAEPPVRRHHLPSSPCLALRMRIHPQSIPPRCKGI